MSLHALRNGTLRENRDSGVPDRAKAAGRRLAATEHGDGRMAIFSEDDLLDQFAGGGLSFVAASDRGASTTNDCRQASPSTSPPTLPIFSRWPGTASST